MSLELGLRPLSDDIEHDISRDGMNEGIDSLILDSNALQLLQLKS